MADNLLIVSEALLAELAGSEEPMSAARICKRLGVRMSTLLRCVSYLGGQAIGGQSGPDLVKLTQDGERTLLSLTEKGRAECEKVHVRHQGP